MAGCGGRLGGGGGGRGRVSYRGPKSVGIGRVRRLTLGDEARGVVQRRRAL